MRQEMKLVFGSVLPFPAVFCRLFLRLPLRHAGEWLEGENESIRYAGKHELQIPVSQHPARSAWTRHRPQELRGRIEGHEMALLSEPVAGNRFAGTSPEFPFFLRQPRLTTHDGSSRRES